jgi:hypothetical protein
MTASWPEVGAEFAVQFEPAPKMPLLPVFQESALTAILRSADRLDDSALPAEPVTVPALSMPVILRSAVVSPPAT